MSIPSLSSETVHATCVVKDGRGILISGRSGSGKSDLALRLIDRGATLVSDDYTVVKRLRGRLVATAPANIAGRMEVRGLGILPFETVAEAPVCLAVDLGREMERMPVANEQVSMAGIKVPLVAVNSLEASAPLKVELALARFGLPPE